MWRLILGGIAILSFDVHLVLGSADSIGPNGINSSGLALNGSGVGIGQVESRRPADIDFDTMSPLDVNSAVNPTQVFWRAPSSVTFNATADNLTEFPGPHAIEIAGIMISTDSMAKGVAPAASLYSIGINPTGSSAEDDYQQAAISANFLATLATQKIWAINLSFGVGLVSGDADGTSTLTSYIDWSAKTHDVLYATGVPHTGPMGPVGGPIPSDNFNGITVAFSKKNGAKYRQVDSDNILTGDDFGPRTFVDILAPGRDIQLATQGNMITSIPDPGRAGTSIAIPHVTGTVALLQQHAKERIMNTPSDQWNVNGNARRHQVMKAVLMNSADKLIDNGTVLHPTTGQPIPEGRLLGMERTVLKQNGTTWFQSEAWLEQVTNLFDTPLDEQMGTGHLNAKRSLQQFIPGEQEVNGHYGTATVGDVPHIGWDFGTIEGPNFPINKYRIEGTLEAGQFFSATLAWDREVEFANDPDMDGQFDSGDTFQPYTDLSDVLRDLDLYLVPAGINDVGEADVFISQSSVTSVEHIFGEIPQTGEYELWVYRNNQFAPDQDYGLAWWYGLAPPIEPPNATGDFNNDRMVDGADLAQWRGDFGETTGGGSDADNDGDSDGADFLAWQRSFGVTSAVPANTAVPEPAALLLCAFAVPWIVRRRHNLLSKDSAMHLAAITVLCGGNATCHAGDIARSCG